MGTKDTAAIRYLQHNEIFADAFNFYIYDGKPVIDPDSLVELDTREIGLPYGGETGAEQPVQRTRDIIKSVTAMADHKAAYLLLAIESQSDIHYAMPVRNMVYDALQYAKQIELAAASHRKSGDYRGAGRDEYLSGFMKKDRLLPVVTLVVYFGAREWDGPLSIYEMFETHDTRLLSLVPDYKINLIAPASIPPQDFNKFRTTLKEVLSFIKYSGDADALNELVNSDAAFRRMGHDEIAVLNNYTDAKLSLPGTEEVLDMCEAIQELERRAAEKAAIEAEDTRITGLLQAVKNLMVNMAITADQAMMAMGLSDNDRKILSAHLN